MIWEAAGRIGMDPRPFTWRQLDDMDIGRQTMEFDVAAIVSQTMLALQSVPRSLEQLNPVRRQLAENAAPVIRLKPSQVNF